MTRHYYLLAGTPGDLIFTVTSNNLNGDVDLFTAGSLRPLGKISIYAGSQPTSATKTVFLRQRETLVLRVEARSADDNEGTYSVRFAGTFEPVLTAPTPPEESMPAPSVSGRTDRNTRRVTSTGARIDEPEPTTTARTETTTNETTGTTTTTQPSTAATESRTETTTAGEPAPSRPEPVRTARTRRPRGRRSRPATTPAPPTPSERSTDTASTDSSAATTSQPTEPALNPRLIIETRDGMRQERFMSTVRSVTVQNGQIVIVSVNGRKVERISLSTVLRMSIEP